MIKHYAFGKSARIITVGQSDFFFSYDTCVAYRDAQTSIRIKNNFSRMTGRHMTQMGCASFEVVEDEVFKTVAERIGKAF